MQKTMGQTTPALNTLTNQQKTLAAKVGKISHQIYAAIVVLILVGGLITFFSKATNDFILHRIEAPTSQTALK
jgi:hypothetical protein